LYISTVDSGNLAGHLLTLRAGLLALGDDCVLPVRLFEGLSDTLRLLLDAMEGSGGRCGACAAIKSRRRLFLAAAQYRHGPRPARAYAWGGPQLVAEVAEPGRHEAVPASEAGASGAGTREATARSDRRPDMDKRERSCCRPCVIGYNVIDSEAGDALDPGC
jgi:hypothetical protein